MGRLQRAEAFPVREQDPLRFDLPCVTCSLTVAISPSSMLNASRRKIPTEPVESSPQLLPPVWRREGRYRKAWLLPKSSSPQQFVAASPSERVTDRPIPLRC